MLTVEFIGHAGFVVNDGDIQILIDPWITPSSIENPILQSFLSKHQTIDYLIPEVKVKREDFDPDIILISHHHAHHAVRSDIEWWLARSKKNIKIISPSLQIKQQRFDFLTIIQNIFSNHEFIFFENDFSYHVGGVHIQGYTHTVRDHFAYKVSTTDGSFLHIADAKANRINWDRRLDPAWLKLRNLSPTLLALTCGAMSQRLVNSSGEPFIIENSFMSPVEAAMLSSQIGAQIVGLMGMFNFSVWKNRFEYAYNSESTESYFSWAMNHLLPSAKHILHRPGMKFRIQNGSLSEILN